MSSAVGSSLMSRSASTSPVHWRRAFVPATGATVSRHGWRPFLGQPLGFSALRRLADMSFLGRLFGGKAPEPAPNSVIIDATLAASLTADGGALDLAVDAALRAYLDAQAKAAQAGDLGGIPFWLRRDSERTGEIEDELRDRIIQRRASEEERKQ